MSVVNLRFPHTRCMQTSIQELFSDALNSSDSLRTCGQAPGSILDHFWVGFGIPKNDPKSMFFHHFGDFWPKTPKKVNVPMGAKCP